MSEYIIELDSKHSIALGLALAEEIRGGDAIRGEIVRCKDCEHYGLGRRCAWSKRFVTPDGFCAWGERK